MNYNELNDYELVSYIHEQNEEANDLLFNKYKPLIISLANQYFKKTHNTGLDLNDLIQEGMIAFSYAINTYDQDKEAMFYTYARKCVERKLISAVVGAGRLKYKYLNESLSYENMENDYNFENILIDNNSPEELIVNKEEIEELESELKERLTKYELQVYEMKVLGFDYKEIAKTLNKDPKNIDNTLQRIKTKLKEIIKSKQ